MLEALAAGGRWLLDVAMAPLAAAVAGPAVDVGAAAAAPAPGRGAAGASGRPPGAAAGIGHGRRAARAVRELRALLRATRAPGVSSLLLRDAEVDGGRVDVRIDDGLVVAVGPLATFPAPTR